MAKDQVLNQASHRCHGGILAELHMPRHMQLDHLSPSDDDSTWIVDKHRLVGTSFVRSFALTQGEESKFGPQCC